MCLRGACISTEMGEVNLNPLAACEDVGGRGLLVCETCMAAFVHWLIMLNRFGPRLTRYHLETTTTLLTILELWSSWSIFLAPPCSPSSSIYSYI